MIPRELSLHWQGQYITVRYTPCWIAASFGELGHLELHADAPLPVTETGYRSQFLDHPPEDFDPAAYVTAWLDREARSPCWQAQREAARQGNPF